MNKPVRGVSGDDGLPAQFGPYTLLSRLSSGGMAELFLALQRSPSGFEKLVVLKRILPAKSAEPTFIAMFVHEARVAAGLSHPNIVQTFDAGEVDGQYFIAMAVRPRRGLARRGPGGHRAGPRGRSAGARARHRARGLRGPRVRAREVRSQRHPPRDHSPRHLHEQRRGELRR